MKKLSMEHTENVRICDASKRVPELEPWNSFSRPKKEQNVRPTEMIIRVNQQLEKLKI